MVTICACPSSRIRGNVEGTFYVDDLRLTRNPTISGLTAVLESHDVTTPQTFALQQNYPNPFNPRDHDPLRPALF